jgi:hypothetical protein
VIDGTEHNTVLCSRDEGRIEERKKEVSRKKPTSETAGAPRMLKSQHQPTQNFTPPSMPLNTIK